MMTPSKRFLISAWLGALAGGPPLMGQTTVGALTSTAAVVPVRLTGVGLVVGLDGSGDRNLNGTGRGAGPSARFVANLLQRFGTAVPPELLRPRNVAAVAVQAEVSPYLRPGSRVDLQVSSLQDAGSLRGGRLLLTGLYSDAGQEYFAGTASGAVVVPDNGVSRFTGRGGASGVVPGGGVIEVDLPRPPVDSTPRLTLHRPGAGQAARIASTINTAIGAGVAVIEDPGLIRLNPPGGAADNVVEFLAGIDSLPVNVSTTPRIVVSSADGSVGTVGNVVLAPATVTHAGITVTIGTTGAEAPGLVQQPAGSTLQDVVAGLHAAGARPAEIAAILRLLRTAGAFNAEISVQ